MEHLQGESGPGPGGTGGSRGDPLLSSSDGLLPASRDRATARGSGGAIRLPPRPGTAARHLTPRGLPWPHATQSPVPLGRALLLAPPFLLLFPPPPAPPLPRSF